MKKELENLDDNMTFAPLYFLNVLECMSEAS